jgi:hypothetical protein
MIASLDTLRDVTGRVWRSPRLDPLRRLKRQLMRRSEGESLLLERFAGHFGRPLDLNAPNTFTEKLFSRMVLWNRRMDPQFTRLADKFAVRSHVADTLGEDYLPTLLWHGTDPEQIPFEALPDRYVVKTNHGSGQVIRVAGKVDRADVARRLSDWLASNYYWRFREYQYYGIPPRVLVEEYLEGAGGREALAYRFWCFGGVPRFLSIGNYARSMCPFYDTSWNKLAIKHKPDANRPSIDKPPNFDQMVDAATRLSREFDFVRVDLYNIDGRVVFGELTFTPAAGMFRFTPVDWDRWIGEMWTLRTSR